MSTTATGRRRNGGQRSADQRWRRLRVIYGHHVGQGEQSLLVAWSAFTTTFALTRALTQWIRAGHGPASGGMSMGGRHIHRPSTRGC
jgi:hypothetical protein